MARFMVNYTFNGRGSDIIQADTLEEVQAIVDAQLDDDNFEPPTDDYDDIDATVIETHPVTRDGHELWTTYVRASDVRGHASALMSTPLFSA